jgi:hypothetical protein
MKSTQYKRIEALLKCSDPVYTRTEKRGRQLPDGLTDIGSWRFKDRPQCFQIMETNIFKAFDKWTAHWNDLLGFGVIGLYQRQRILTKTRSNK